MDQPDNKPVLEDADLDAMIFGADVPSDAPQSGAADADAIQIPPTEEEETTIDDLASGWEAPETPLPPPDKLVTLEAWRSELRTKCDRIREVLDDTKRRFLNEPDDGLHGDTTELDQQHTTVTEALKAVEEIIRRTNELENLQGAEREEAANALQLYTESNMETIDTARAMLLPEVTQVMPRPLVQPPSGTPDDTDVQIPPADTTACPEAATTPAVPDDKAAEVAKIHQAINGLRERLTPLPSPPSQEPDTLSVPDEPPLPSAYTSSDPDMTNPWFDEESPPLWGSTDESGEHLLLKFREALATILTNVDITVKKSAGLLAKATVSLAEKSAEALANAKRRIATRKQPTLQLSFRPAGYEEQFGDSPFPSARQATTISKIPVDTRYRLQQIGVLTVVLAAAGGGLFYIVKHPYTYNLTSTTDQDAKRPDVSLVEVTHGEPPLTFKNRDGGTPTEISRPLPPPVTTIPSAPRLPSAPTPSLPPSPPMPAVPLPSASAPVPARAPLTPLTPAEPSSAPPPPRPADITDICSIVRSSIGQFTPFCDQLKIAVVIAPKDCKWAGNTPVDCTGHLTMGDRVSDTFKFKPGSSEVGQTVVDPRRFRFSNQRRK